MGPIITRRRLIEEFSDECLRLKRMRPEQADINHTSIRLNAIRDFANSLGILEEVDTLTILKTVRPYPWEVEPDE